MSTFKVARIAGPRKIEIVDWEMPALRADEVLIKILTCAICTSERGGYTGERAASYPSYMGHEISGLVEEVGSEVVLDVKPGDHVAVSRMNRCDQCYNCRSYTDNRCVNSRRLHRPGRQPGPGGFSEYLVVPSSQVFKFARPVDKVSASLTEPAACCISSADKANVTFGDDVLVVGAGVMGLIHTSLLRMRGARVIVSEINPDRLELAKQFGADEVVDPTDNLSGQILALTHGKGLDAAFITGGPQALVPGLFDYCRVGAPVVLYTSYHGANAAPAQIDLNRIHYGEINLVGTVSPKKHDFQRAVTLVSNERLKLDSLVEEVYPFERIQEAFEHGIRPGTYRVVVDIGLGVSGS